MDYRSKLVVFTLSLLAGSAHAGYANLKAPENWQKTPTASLVRVAANDASFVGGVRTGFAGLTTSASMVQVPAAYRFAANAGKFAATAAFGWPGVFLLAGGLAYQWFTDNGLEVDDGVWKKNVIESSCPAGHSFVGSSCIGYYMSAALGTYASKGAACASYSRPSNATWNYTGNYLVDGMQCKYQAYNNATPPTYSFPYTGTLSISTLPPSTFTGKIPVTQIEFETTMSPQAVPVGVPQVWPLTSPMWWPVNPTPIINPSPGSNPVSQPLRIPQGEPVMVPNPNYDPVTDPNPNIWRQPVIDVVPAPTPDAPWRVDLQPKDIFKPTPDSQLEPESVPDPANDPDAKPSEKSDFCVDNPNVLACQIVDLGTLEPQLIPNENKPLSIEKESGFGPENGTCPAPKTAVVAGLTLSMPFDLICDFASAIRPLLIGFAWLSAAFTFFGFARKD